MKLCLEQSMEVKFRTTQGEAKYKQSKKLLNKYIITIEGGNILCNIRRSH